MSEEVKFISHDEPRQMFLDTLREFRHKLGDCNFWNLDLEQRNATIYALGQDYLRCEHGDNLDGDAKMLDLAIREYNMRETMLIKLGKVRMGNEI